LTSVLNTLKTTKKPRPPLVKVLPLIGPAREFLGDVLPFFTKSRATYGDAFRIRMMHVEMTCLFGSDAIDLLKSDSGLRTSNSMHVLDAELQSRLPSMFEGSHHQTFRKAHLQVMNRNLETKMSRRYFEMPQAAHEALTARRRAGHAA
jgi:hypothetical protein